MKALEALQAICLHQPSTKQKLANDNQSIRIFVELLDVPREPIQKLAMEFLIDIFSLDESAQKEIIDLKGQDRVLNFFKQKKTGKDLRLLSSEFVIVFLKKLSNNSKLVSNFQDVLGIDCYAAIVEDGLTSAEEIIKIFDKEKERDRNKEKKETKTL